MKKLFQITQTLSYIASAGFVFYILACAIDINAHNLTDLAYSWWNVFLYL